MENNVRFLITMNMPSAQGYSVHQVTVDHTAPSLADFCDLLNEYDFVIVRLTYRMKGPNGESLVRDRGDMVLNTAHIGKVQEFVQHQNTEDGDRDEATITYSDHRANPVRFPSRRRG